MPKPEQKKENLSLRVDLDYRSDLVHGAVRLGCAVEQMTDAALPRDAAALPTHIDRKRRRKLQQKKAALGHKEDDHEDRKMEQQL